MRNCAPISRNVVLAVVIATIFLIGVSGCATIGRGSSNYIENDMTVPALKGHAYYFVTGTVNVWSCLDCWLQDRRIMGLPC